MLRLNDETNVCIQFTKTYVYTSNQQFDLYPIGFGNSGFQQKVMFQKDGSDSGVESELENSCRK